MYFFYINIILPLVPPGHQTSPGRHVPPSRQLPGQRQAGGVPRGGRAEWRGTERTRYRGAESQGEVRVVFL